MRKGLKHNELHLGDTVLITKTPKIIKKYGNNIEKGFIDGVNEESFSYIIKQGYVVAGFRNNVIYISKVVLTEKTIF